MFAVSRAGKLTAATVRNQLARVRARHIAWNAEWHGGKRLQYVLSGVEKQHLHSSRWSLHLPVTQNMLRALHRNLDLKAPFDAAVFAAACMMFWGQCRAGELLPQTTTPAGQVRKPKRLDAHPPSRSNTNFEVSLLLTKTHYIQGEKIILLHQKGSTDPIHAMRYHLYINCLKAKDPLFAYITTHGSRALTKPAFLAQCNAIWAGLGYPRLTSHCFRIGGTTELLLSSVAPHVVKQSGRWALDAFLQYWRSVENILPKHMQRVVPAKRSHN
jgi:hypothetical protein